MTPFLLRVWNLFSVSLWPQYLVIALLSNTHRIATYANVFEPNLVDKLDEYVNQQLKDNTFDLEANLHLLRCMLARPHPSIHSFTARRTRIGLAQGSCGRQIPVAPGGCRKTRNLFEDEFDTCQSYVSHVQNGECHKGLYVRITVRDRSYVSRVWKNSNGVAPPRYVHHHFRGKLK